MIRLVINNDVGEYEDVQRMTGQYLTIKNLYHTFTDSSLIDLSELVSSTGSLEMFGRLRDPLNCRIKNENELIDMFRVLDYLIYLPELMTKFCQNQTCFKFACSYMGNYHLEHGNTINLDNLDIELPGIYEHFKHFNLGDEYVPIDELPTEILLPSWKARFNLNKFEFKHDSKKFTLDLNNYEPKLERLTHPWLENFPWKRFSNVCLTGGTMLSAISNLEEDPYQDIDMFVYGDDPKQTSAEVVNYFRDMFGHRLIYSIKGGVVTMYLLGCTKPLQLIPCRSENPHWVLKKFDISCVKIYRDYTGCYISLCTYFELMRGFTEVYEPLEPYRLRKYLLKSLTVVSKSPFVLRSEDKYLNKGLVDTKELLNCRDLAVEEDIKWFPSHTNEVGMVARVLKNSIENVQTDLSAILVKLKNSDLNRMGSYQNSYHIGYLNSLPLDKLESIPLKPIGEWSSYHINRGIVEINELHINSINFWVGGEAYLMHHQTPERNHIALGFKISTNLLRSISKHFNRVLKQSFGSYMRREEDIIMFTFVQDYPIGSDNIFSWINIKVDTKYHKLILKKFGKKTKMKVSVQAGWDKLMYINGRAYMKPRLVNIL